MEHHEHKEEADERRHEHEAEHEHSHEGCCHEERHTPIVATGMDTITGIRTVILMRI